MKRGIARTVGQCRSWYRFRRMSNLPAALFSAAVHMMGWCYAVASDVTYMCFHSRCDCAQRGDVLVHVIESLGERRRQVIVMMRLHHLPVSDVAFRIGVSADRIDAIYRFALGSVRRRLAFHGVGFCGFPPPGQPKVFESLSPGVVATAESSQGRIRDAA